MAMSGISLSADCLSHHEKQRKQKICQWTIYKISNAKETDSDQKGGKKPPKQEITVEKLGDKCLAADDLKGKDKEEICCRGKDVFMQFVNDLPDDAPRYAVFDSVVLAKSGAAKDKMRFIAWCPDNCGIKDKMVYSSTKDTIRKKLNVEGKELFLNSKNADDLNDAYMKLLDE